MGYSLKDFPRLEKLREAMLKADRSVCVERARYYTEYYADILPEEEKSEGRKIPPVLRQARAFRHIMKNRSVKIYPDEFIVGGTTSKLVGGLIFPEFLHLAVWPELNTISHREDNPFIIEQKEIDELNDVIFPRFMETNILQRAKEIWDETRDKPLDVDPFNILEKFSFFLLSKANGISHIAPDYPKGIKLGFEAIAKEALERVKQFRENGDFYKAIITVCEGIISFAKRHAEEARREAKREKDKGREEELIKIAEICERVPAKPAGNLHEALQSLWFIQIALHQENYDMGISFGRGDQYLYPYYKKDVKDGNLTEKKALELLGCFWIKATDHVAFTPSTGSLFFGGTPSNQPMTIGGVDKSGKDATNELTYLMLEASAMLGVREPNLSARIHRDSPQEYLLKVAETIEKSHGTPAVYNDDYIIPNNA
ncbi:MAG: pyruvate formate lyase family protein [Nitrospinota bacterium]